ncbi:MAG: helix-turn-helix domain-containing protein, partial [Phycisphaeraceae bacterium]
PHAAVAPEPAPRKMNHHQLPHPSLHEISLAGVLDALADPVRLSIVSALADGRERPWGALDAGVCNSTLSHHVKVLREAGLIAHRKEGTR